MNLSLMQSVAAKVPDMVEDGALDVLYLSCEREQGSGSRQALTGSRQMKTRIPCLP